MRKRGGFIHSCWVSQTHTHTQTHSTHDSQMAAASYGVLSQLLLKHIWRLWMTRLLLYCWADGEVYCSIVLAANCAAGVEAVSGSGGGVNRFRYLSKVFIYSLTFTKQLLRITHARDVFFRHQIETMTLRNKFCTNSPDE